MFIFQAFYLIELWLNTCKEGFNPKAIIMSNMYAMAYKPQSDEPAIAGPLHLGESPGKSLTSHLTAGCLLPST